ALLRDCDFDSVDFPSERRACRPANAPMAARSKKADVAQKRVAAVHFADVFGLEREPVSALALEIPSEEGFSRPTIERFAIGNAAEFASRAEVRPANRVEPQAGARDGAHEPFFPGESVTGLAHGTGERVNEKSVRRFERSATENLAARRET